MTAETNHTIETIETPDDGMEALKKQAEAKRQALEQPKRSEATNQACQIGDSVGVYNGSWLSKGAKGYPGGGDGKFTSSDSKTILDGTRDSKGVFQKGKIKKENKEINIENYRINTQTREFLYYKGTSDFGGNHYEGKWDKNFNLTEVKYSGITLKLEVKSDGTYLKNSGGNTVKLGNVDAGLACTRIAKCISIVKNSGKDLDYFERDGDTLQADYLGTGWDTDLLKNCSWKTGVNSNALVNWLNKSRTDFGI